MARIAAASLLVALSLAEPVHAGEWSRWYSDKAPEPSGLTVHVCHGINCGEKSRVALSAAEIRRIAAPLARARNAASERDGLSEAVAGYERLVGPRAGTEGDRRGIEGWTGRGQIDCIGEATNTTSLLILLERNGYLRFHTVAAPESRGSFLDGRYPHSTAVVAEKGGDRWSVDSWPRANGEPPVIMEMSRWRREKSAMLD